MLIKLDNHYSKYTNGFSDHLMDGDTVQQCMSELCNRYPQLLVHLQDDQAAMCKKSGLKLNGEFIIDSSEAALPVLTEDVLELTLDIPTGEDSIVKYIVGAVLLIVGVIVGIAVGWTGGGAMLAGYMISMGISMMISTAVMDAFFTPETPHQDTPTLLDNSATYTFTGIRNTTASGTPIQVVYGEHRLGGHVLNMFLTTEGGYDPAYGGMDTITTSNYLYAQIGLCEGEIQSLSAIQINQLDQEFYNEVVCDYRTGSATQSVMPDYTLVQNTTSIGRKVAYAGSTGQVQTTFSDYTPVLGYVSYDAWRPELKLGMYTSALVYTEEVV